MPEIELWEQFFDPDPILRCMQLDPSCDIAVEFGAGYGTFTLAAAQRINGTVHSFDIEPALVDTVTQRAEALGLRNVRASVRDFLKDGTGLATASADYAMVFNILHHSNPHALLQEAHRVLRQTGKLGIIHWVHDETTPRGPPMNMRPRPEQCVAWAVEAGFEPVSGTVDLPPFHFGLVFRSGS